MEDLKTVLDRHPTKEILTSTSNAPIGGSRKDKEADLYVKLPTILFDKVLLEHKLTRIELMVLICLYRRVWSVPNINKKHGISEVLSHKEIINELQIDSHELYHSIRKIETLGFIETIRAGQYFVRKYFTKQNDSDNGQTYDDFL
jgi:DNA-binding MarR family transcriptional regulator